MKPFYKLLSAAASVAIVVAVIWGLHAGGGRDIVFADVVAPFRHIQSLACDTVQRVNRHGEVTTRMSRLFEEADRMRNEVWEGGKQPSVIWIDRGDERYAVNPSTRRFTRMKRSSTIPSHSDALNMFASLPDAKVERDLGEQVRPLLLIGLHLGRSVSRAGLLELLKFFFGEKLLRPFGLSLFAHVNGLHDP